MSGLRILPMSGKELNMPEYLPEPFRIKMVEPLKISSREERIEALKEAKYNLFSLKSDFVYIDMLTDSGTNAMSDAQWGALMMADESYAGSSSYYNLLESCEKLFPYKYFQPVHQGRAGEKIIYNILLSEGKKSISNMHFDTTRGHVALAGAEAVDCVVPEAQDTENYYTFKGNMDIASLEEKINNYGKEQVGVIIMTITNNSAGGQPVSMENLRQTYAIAQKYEIPLVIDAARFAENAFFIKEREEGYADKSILEIVREMFSYSDAFAMSAKKDAIVSMGGLLGVREDEVLFEKIKGLTVPMEGFVTYGGLSGRDLSALAVGLQEGIDENFLRYYIGQSKYLGEILKEAGVPFQYPTGGHAVFLDAAKILPHIPYYEFPGQSLALALYIEGGIRGCDIGSYILDPDPVTGEQLKAEMEFTRLCIPRRTYTQAHLDYVAKTIIKVYENKEKYKGYKVVKGPKVLRHFTAELEPLA